MVLTAVLLAIGWAAYEAHIPSRTAPAFFLDIVLGALVFCCLGFAVASLRQQLGFCPTRRSGDRGPTVFHLRRLHPDHGVARWLIDIGKIFPVHALAAALLAAYNPHTSGSGLSWSDLAVLAAWGVAGS